MGLALDEAREKAELGFLIAPALGECYLLSGQQELPADINALDPSSSNCSQLMMTDNWLTTWRRARLIVFSLEQSWFGFVVP